VLRTALCGAFAVAAAVTPAVAFAGEPDDSGPFEVETLSYDFGDEAFTAPGFGGPVEFRGVVYSPAQLDQGPFPLVILLHGRHSTCYDPANPSGFPGDGSFLGAFSQWPCEGNRIAIPSHEGYALPATTLASHGYIVVSISANGINAADNNLDDGGAEARARLIITHLNQWAMFTEGGAAPFGRKYIGAVDLERVGLFGHSRGGEGVARALLLDQDSGGAIGIDAAFLLAPVDFTRPVLSDVPLAVVLPYCDGDVMDLQGAHYFDDARYANPSDLAEKYIFAMQRSNHNYFNTTWSPSTFVSGAVDDFGAFAEFVGTDDPECSEGAGSVRLTELEQQAVHNAYFTAFFRRHLGEDEAFDPILRGDEEAESAGAAAVYATYLAPTDPTTRLDINHLDTDGALQTNTLGEAVSGRGIDGYTLCGLADANEQIDHCVDDLGMLGGEPFDGRQPHTPGLGQLRIAFSAGAEWANALPAGTDASAYGVFQFRAAVDFEGPPRAQGGVQMTVRLRDGSGATASVDVDDYTSALGPPLGEMTPVLPKKQLNGIRLPLADFEGVDLTDLASVEFVFNGQPGALVVSDLAFSDALQEDDPGGTGTGGSDGTDGMTGAVDESAGDDGAGTAGDTTSGSGTDSGTGAAQDGEDGDGGCGCRQDPAGGGSAPLLLGVLGLMRRRRYKS